MPNFEVPADLLQALHDYLVSRPMVEVEPLVARLRQCKRVQPAPDATE